VWEIDREDTISVFVKRKPNLKDFEDELVPFLIKLFFLRKDAPLG
jgi:hypothetical protein